MKADPIDYSDAREVTKRILRRRITTINEALPGGSPLRIELCTRMTPPFVPGTSLLMDWSHRFTRREATIEAWNQYLLTALMDVEEAVRLHAPGRPLEVAGFPALPAAIALGATFLDLRRTTKISWRQQMPDGSEQLWSIQGEEEDSGFRVLPPIEGAPQSGDLALLVSVDSNVEAAFSASQSELPRFRATIHLASPGVDKHNLTDPKQARHIAHLIVGAVRDVRSRYRKLDTTHLFMAVPAGLGMMTGQLLNTLGPIQTYEHIPIDGVGRYSAAVLLHPSE